MSESAVCCAYELCKRTDPIEVIAGHRAKRYHDDNCRQAQHRLLEARALLTTLRQLWAEYLPATQQLLENLLRQQGEACVRSVATAIAAERDQARQPVLSEDERAALKCQWSDLQRGTQQILGSLLNNGRGDPSVFFHLILLAINEERRHAQCNSELDQRAAELEIKVSAYRAIIDLEDRAKLVEQFLAVGQLLDYRAIPTFRIDAGLQAWQDYQSWTYEDTLAEVIVYGREVLSEEKAVTELAENRSKLRQAQREVQELRERIQAMEAIPAHQAAPVPALLAIQAYFHAHAGASLPLQRGSQKLQLTALRSDGVAAATGHGLVDLDAEELHFLAKQTGTTILALNLHQEHQIMQARLSAIGDRLQYRRLLFIPGINAGVECWQQFINNASYEQLCQVVQTAEHYYGNLVYLDELEQQSRQAAQEKQQQKSRPHPIEQELVEAQKRIAELEQEQRQGEGPRTLREKVMLLQAYLHTHFGHYIPLQRGKEQFAMKLIRDDGTGSASLQGPVSLTHAEIEQMLQWVAEKTNTSTETHSSYEHKENVHLHQRVQELQRELTRYEPPPRALLECTLRQWSTRTKLFYQDSVLVGEELDRFLQESSDQRLLKFIESGESCYFIGKHHERRIGIIASAIEQGQELVYRGDQALLLRSIDVQGMVTFANGMQRLLTYDDVKHFWALVAAETGQQHVSQNMAISVLQRYLCEHPGQSIPIRSGKNGLQIILVDDDRLAITAKGKLKWLFDDELEQARRWVRKQS